MSPIASQRYKELKDWLKIASPISAAFIVVFKGGVWYQDFKQSTYKWNGYESTISTLSTDLQNHKESDNRIHAEMWHDMAEIKKDFNDKIFQIEQKINEQ